MKGKKERKPENGKPLSPLFQRLSFLFSLKLTNAEKLLPTPYSKPTGKKRRRKNRTAKNARKAKNF